MNATATKPSSEAENRPAKPKSRITMIDANAIVEQQQQLMSKSLGQSASNTFKTNPSERLTHKSNLPDLNTPATVADFDVPNRTFRLIPLNRIRQNRFAPRSVYTDAMLKERAESIRDEGQNDPIHVIPDPDFPGDFIIGDGWTRVQGCLKYGICDELLAEIHEDKDEREISLLGYDQNENRAGHCDYDRARFFNALLESGYLQTDIEARFKISQSRVSKLAAFLKLPEEALEVVKKYPQRVNYRIAGLLANVYNNTNAETTTVLTKRYCLTDGMTEKGFEMLCKKTVHDFKANPDSFGDTPSPSANAETQAKGRRQNRVVLQTFEGGKFVRRDGVYKLDLKVAPEKETEFQEAMKKLLEQFATPAAEDSEEKERAQ